MHFTTIIISVLLEVNNSNIVTSNETISSQLSIGEWVAVATITLTVISSIGWLIFRTGGLYNMVTEMKVHVDKIQGMEVKVEELWRLKTTVSSSPMILNETGKKYLMTRKYKSLQTSIIQR